jgi:DNA-binding GntR family transcriptional regulator
MLYVSIGVGGLYIMAVWQTQRLDARVRSAFCMSDGLLRDQVHHRLAEAIVRGELEPGARLNEVHLADELGVSRSPVREALRQLETEGLAVFTPRKGTVVAGIDPAEVAQFYDCRILVVCECVRLVTPVLDDDALARLDAVYGRMTGAAAAEERHDYLGHVAEFHELLRGACPNAVLADVIQRLERRAMRFRSVSHRAPGRLDESLRGHRALLAALHAHDVSAAVEAMAEMLTRSRASILATLGSAETVAPA